ncbi:MAG: crotonase/enoyl-CoA hydratase family protein [Bacteroidota bacterium]
MEYQALSIKIADHVAHVEINRPEKANALDQNAFDELTRAFGEMDANPEVRVIVLSGIGKHFCAGIDLSLLLGLPSHIEEACDGRKREKLRQLVFRLQEPMNAAEKCRKPVLAAVHKGCIGAGLDLISACDMRYATEDAFFTIKEIDMGMVADLGTLQRLPGILPEGVIREMAYTGRHVGAQEAKERGLVNEVYADQETMLAEVMKVAHLIAAKSPLSIRGTKEILNFNREQNISAGLKNIAVWNAAMILSEDLAEAGQSAMMKRKPEFRN